MINIAVLGLGYIAGRVCEGINYANNAKLYSVVSRDNNKGDTFKEKYQAVCSYDDYDAMLCDPLVDLVFICTPNHLHVEQIMNCFRHHKHVICEKPMVASIQEIEYLFEQAKKYNCFLMEAEKTAFTDLNVELLKMVEDGEIGKLESIVADYSYDVFASNYPKDHWAYNDIYGGSSYDVGVYPICFANYFAQAKIKDVKANNKYYPGFKCDFHMQSIIAYENDVKAIVHSSWLYTSKNRGTAFLYGTKGFIEVPAYWKLNKAILFKDGKETPILIPQNSDFQGEVEHASLCIEKGLLESPIMGKAATLEIMKVLEEANKDRLK